MSDVALRLDFDAVYALLILATLVNDFSALVSQLLYLALVVVSHLN